MSRVPVQPDLLRWARERAGYSVDALAGRFPKLGDWELGKVQPTLKQLEAFAKSDLHVPLGFLFLAEPPVERVPIPDFRRIANRTSWIAPALTFWTPSIFASSARTGTAILLVRCTIQCSGSSAPPAWKTTSSRVAARIRYALGARPGGAPKTRHLDRCAAALHRAGGRTRGSGHGQRRRREQQSPRPRPAGIPRLRLGGPAGAAGLHPRCRYQGSADVHARPRVRPPLARSNPPSRMPKPAPHPIRQSSAGATGSRPNCWFRSRRCAAISMIGTRTSRLELNRLGATLQGQYPRNPPAHARCRLADPRRALDGLRRGTRAVARPVPKGRGGDFYLTLGARVSKRFARALVVSTLEGHTAFTETFRMLGLKKMETFNELGRSLGVGY